MRAAEPTRTTTAAAAAVAAAARGAQKASRATVGPRRGHAGERRPAAHRPTPLSLRPSVWRSPPSSGRDPRRQASGLQPWLRRASSVIRPLSAPPRQTTGRRPAQGQEARTPPSSCLAGAVRWCGGVSACGRLCESPMALPVPRWRARSYLSGDPITVYAPSHTA